MGFRQEHPITDICDGLQIRANTTSAEKASIVYPVNSNCKFLQSCLLNIVVKRYINFRSKPITHRNGDLLYGHVDQRERSTSARRDAVEPEFKSRVQTPEDAFLRCAVSHHRIIVPLQIDVVK